MTAFKQADPAIGVLMSDGGRGAFPADIIEVGDCYVIAANPNWGGIEFEPRTQASHAVLDVPHRVYINKLRGFIVAPKKQVVLLSERNRK